MVIWLIGLSGSGKTTIGERLVERLKEKTKRDVIFLDGDAVRKVFGGDVDHSVEGRRINARRISYLSKLLADQGIMVVAAVLSIFPEWQRWNRQSIRDYFQVFLDVPMDVLMRREIKGLYSGALNGSIKNVVGVDIEFPIPVDNDLVLSNSEDRSEFSDLLDEICLLPELNALD